jgi:ketosteroid isomerase-like protein
MTAILPYVSRERIEMIEGSLSAWNRGDIDGVFEFTGPELEWMIAEENPEARTLQGMEEVRAYMADWRSSVQGLHYETVEYLDAGDSVVSLGTVTGQMGSAELKAGLNLVVRFAEGVPVRIEEYLDQDKALAAVGLETDNR